jgi:4-amino-4-deoxy-L-arabinose transferase-like glycosyltransferase
LNLENTERRQGLTAAVFLTGLIVIAIALRFWRLGDWNFQATEMFTLRDSVTPQFRNPRPLGYLLTYYLVRPFRPLDEFGLRLLPAIFGVLAVPALYFVSRRLVGVRAALFGTLFLAVSPLHILYSQLARYWSLVFLLSAIYPYAIYIGVRERNRWALALGVVTGVLAVLAHPVSVLLVGGLGIWMTVTYLRPRHLAQLWKQRSVRWTAFLLIVVAAVIAMRFIPMLQSWVSQHDRNPGSGQFLLSPRPQGLKQVQNLLAFVESLTVPLTLSWAVGTWWLWKERDRSLAVLLLALAAFPVAFIILVSLRTPGATYYMLPAVPAFFIGAGVLLDRLADINWELRPRWLLAAMVAATIVAAGAPTLMSDYRDGRRYNFRAAAQWLQNRVVPGDFVFSDQFMVLTHYLPGTKVERLRHDTTPLIQSVQLLRQSGRPGAVWIVAPAPSHAVRSNLRHGGLIDWMYANCQLRNTIGRGRVDFRQNYLQIYRCPPSREAPAAPDPAPSG